MTKHILKLVWNRKRFNALIMTEIFFSFLVLFAVTAIAVFYVDNYRRPLGFEYERVWSVDLGGSDIREQGKGPTPERIDQVHRIVRTLQDLPEVEAVAGIDLVPFRVGANSGTRNFRGKRLMVRFNSATETLDEATGIRMLEGRWFEPSDAAIANYIPVVINRSLGEAVFGGANPLGEALDRDGPEEGKPLRVVGVIEDFRQHGEFHAPYHYMFYYKNLQKMERDGQQLLVRVRPGVTVAFEEKLMRTLQGLAPNYSHKIEPLAKLRKEHMQMVLTPVIAASLIAAFLILMVGLGMVGVVWQTVTRRSREIGLRRAVGSTANGVYHQILGELMLVATMALAFGVALAVQIPLLELITWISKEVLFTAMGIAVLFMYGLTLFAGLYPSWMASKVQPAEVLRYE